MKNCLSNNTQSSPNTPLTTSTLLRAFMSLTTSSSEIRSEGMVYKNNGQLIILNPPYEIIL
jgi:hypothetical protein